MNKANWIKSPVDTGEACVNGKTGEHVRFEFTVPTGMTAVITLK